MNIKIEIDKAKLKAIQFYLPDGVNLYTDIEALTQKAVEKEVDKIYKKYVPRSVKDFLARSAELKLKSKQSETDEPSGDED